MFERLKRLYTEGKITKAGLSAAVKRGWITQNEMLAIIASKEE